LVVSGVIAACVAASAGLALLTTLVVIGWIAAPHPRVGLIAVLRTAAVLWLVAHHVAVQVHGAGRIGMLPLGLVLLPGALLWRAGRYMVRGQAVTGLRQVVAAALGVAFPYAVLAAALALASRSALATASAPEALLAGFVIAFVAAGFGAARALAPWAQLAALMSPRTRSVLAGTASSLLVLGAGGCAVTAFALASHVHEFSAVYHLLDPGMVGAGLLLLAQLAYLPNAVIWAAAYLLGPGFAVGVGTVVAPTGSVVAALPAFPLLAALPGVGHGSGPGWLSPVMLAIPYLAGASGGLLVARLAPTMALESAPIRGFCSGVLTGAVLGVAAGFAGGPLGDGRMSAVGPSAWQVATVAALEVGVAAAITAGAANWWRVRGSVADGDIGPGQQARPGGGAGGAVSRGGAPSSRRRSDADDGHVIYLDRWAGEKDAETGTPRSADPSALP
jgi:Family of unknown function (DUF6350)